MAARRGAPRVWRGWRDPRPRLALVCWRCTTPGLTRFAGRGHRSWSGRPALRALRCRGGRVGDQPIRWARCEMLGLPPGPVDEHVRSSAGRLSGGHRRAKGLRPQDGWVGTRQGWARRERGVPPRRGTAVCATTVRRPRCCPHARRRHHGCLILLWEPSRRSRACGRSPGGVPRNAARQEVRGLGTRPPQDLGPWPCDLAQPGNRRRVHIPRHPPARSRSPAAVPDGQFLSGRWGEAPRPWPLPRQRHFSCVQASAICSSLNRQPAGVRTAVQAVRKPLVLHGGSPSR
jgi:hypothetical protein